jgi:hypothetical protein
MVLQFTHACFRRLLPFWLGVSLWAGAPSPSFAQQLVFDTAYPIGNAPGGGESWFRGLARDAQGNVYVGGYFAGSLTFGTQRLVSLGSAFDIYVAKYDEQGTLLWVQQAGLAGDDRLLALTVDAAGNVYIGGTYGGTTQFGAFSLPSTGNTYDAFVAKLDPAGTWQWAVSSGGSGVDRVNAVAIGPTGELTVGGDFGGPSARFGATELPNADAAAQATDVFVAQLSATGTWLRATRAGGPGIDQLADLAVDGAGAAYACGEYHGAQAQFGSTSLSNGSPGQPDAYVAKLDATGRWQWATHLGGTGQGQLLGLALDGSGRPYVTGQFSGATLTLGTTTLINAAAGTSDILVAALTSEGSWRWVQRAGDVGTDLAYDLAVGPTGQVVLTGEFLSTHVVVGPSDLLKSSAAGNGEAFVAQLDATGTWVGGLVPTGSGEKYGWRVVVGAEGETYVGGAYWGTRTQFGETTLPGSEPFPNGFVAHVADAAALAQLTSVAPTSGIVGQAVTVTGSGFTDVRGVRFNGVPASYTVASPTRLTATVPAGATAGPLRVRTGAGTSASTPFLVSGALASLAPRVLEGSQVWPNPVPVTGLLEVALAPSLPLGGPTQVLVYNSVGELVAQTTFSGHHLHWQLPVSAGLYQVTVRAAGQPSWQQRLVVTD